MKKTMMILALVLGSTNAFASLSDKQVVRKILNLTEVKAITEAYKRKGIKCDKPEVVTNNGQSISARMFCQDDLSGVIPVINAEIYEGELLLTNINFEYSG